MMHVLDVSSYVVLKSIIFQSRVFEVDVDKGSLLSYPLSTREIAIAARNLIGSGHQVLAGRLGLVEFNFGLGFDVLY
jgi:hypothetical protein